MAAAAAQGAARRPAALGRDEMHGTEGASLIARAHALNKFIEMQGRAAAAASAAADARGPRSRDSAAAGSARPAAGHASTTNGGCLCFGVATATSPLRGGGGGGSGGGGGHAMGGTGVGGAAGTRRGLYHANGPPHKPQRAYFPDNLSAQPQRHPWGPEMEWVILGCVDLLEADGLREPNLFAVSAVDDLVRNLVLPVGNKLPPNTDPHVASGAIKNRIRHATEPLVSKACLRRYIETQPVSAAQQVTSGDSRVAQNTIASGSAPAAAVAGPAADAEFSDTHLANSLRIIEGETSRRRAYIFARIMRLLGRVSANVAESRMNAHCLAKCVAPSMLHWDPNSTFSLLMLGKITAYVMTMIEEARVHDEALCEAIDKLA